MTPEFDDAFYRVYGIRRPIISTIHGTMTPPPKLTRNWTCLWFGPLKEGFYTGAAVVYHPAPSLPLSIFGRDGEQLHLMNTAKKQKRTPKEAEKIGQGSKSGR